MIFSLFKQYPNVMMGIGMFFTFVITAFFTHKLKGKLPADEGRDFAVDGKLSKGKPRGAGIIFIATFILGVILFSPIRTEYLIYIVLVGIEMLTGYLDDRSEKPWGRLKKGLMDFMVASMIAFTYVHYNGSSIKIASLGITWNLPWWAFYIICVAIVWASINVTNCADGVDGLSGSLALITLASFYIADIPYEHYYRFTYIIMYFVMAILAYLLFNAGPSILMMGDAGSRAMGLFIAIVALKSQSPFLYLVFAIVLFLDGGLGLFKITCIKILKKNPFKKLRTPLHDHVRKNLEVNWSNNQCVMRFTIIQILINVCFIYLFLR